MSQRLTESTFSEVSSLGGKHVLALSGGVGGAKLALGLSKLLPSEQLTIVANTADDFEHLGLSISPDLDTVMYTLAGINNQKLGWGLANESWNAMDAMETLGGESWFRLGDRDIATHLERSQRLRRGDSLSCVTDYLSKKLGIKHRILPMTDDSVRTQITTTTGLLAFQEYFVREQCKPVITDYAFAGIDTASPQAAFMELLESDQLGAIIICPSNPFVSVEPILSLPGVRAAMIATSAPIIAVSPIVGGAAIKGPAAKMMKELSLDVSATGVAEYYGNLLNGFILDDIDADLRSGIGKLGPVVSCAPSVMKTLEDRMVLARAVLSFSEQLSKSGNEKNIDCSGRSL
ncbi:MAG: LPPG:FO 2-phospho-L-lactate transferase [Oceanicoccus sp.]|jgi:LPPG:FO 2-phospho-L-lactate transferase